MNKLTPEQRVKAYFMQLRFDDKYHLGLGDIRLTIGMQEEVIALTAQEGECRSCNGSGLDVTLGMVSDCRSCSGTGKITAHTEPEGVCPECGGVNEAGDNSPCPVCTPQKGECRLGIKNTCTDRRICGNWCANYLDQQEDK